MILALTCTVAKQPKRNNCWSCFENLTGKELNSGEFFITETNERIEIKDAQSFK
jgi:hypothetical protein